MDVKVRVKTFLRVGQTKRNNYKVVASTKPNHKPLDNGGYKRWKKYLPTVHFALVLNIPKKAFEKASVVVAELNVPEEDLEINAEVEHSKEES